MARIEITPTLSIDESELEITFVRSSGPGGQNVNKVATAAQLRFDAAHTRSLPGEIQARLISRAGSRITRDGVLIITARRFRTQERNRADAIQRLVEMIRTAATPPKRRRKTKVSRTAKANRVDAKRRRSATKRLRGNVSADE
ncbi:MAG TPA: alternative ribosome rescue aminoacyl-tRNA hydrolase ArfB [Candidatus Krumholzibacteria bacterium]|nr:alternative ribosome rescue aminoacyl-tRNA hydrolase ArfB [Candidatus Krumholzibacteria bacterium]